ncbi:MAG TPA: DMT family transporter [Magnetospirillaceae bacterium]|nr:DMT family transporter [Magnetospirillaceae bacterium]
MARLRADLSLLLAAFIWGTAFVAQKTAIGSIGPLLFLGCRFLISTALLTPLALRESRRREDDLTGSDWKLALYVGLSLFGGMAIQQIGIVSTTATNAGFLTAIYVVMVPVVGWALHRNRPSLTVVASCCVSLAGAWMLGQGGGSSSWGMGDVLVLVSDIFQALQIILVERFLSRHSRPLLLSFLQYAVITVLAFAGAFAFEPIVPAGIWAVMPQILYAGVLSGGIAFTLQIVAQRHTPAAEAAIIMSLESLFAALAGAWLLGDRLGPAGLFGCALILAGVLLVQLVPLWRRKSLEPAAAPPQDAP